mgnify:CR=1 FL=1
MVSVMLTTKTLKKATSLLLVGAMLNVTACKNKYDEAFKQGEAVYIDSAGNVAEYTVTIDDDTQRFLGFAAEDGHDTTVGKRVSVWVPDDQTVFIGSLYHGTAASAVAARTDMGTLLPLAYDTTNSKVYVDKENTAGQEDRCRIVGIYADESPSEEAIGDVYAQVLFVVEAVGNQIGQ